MGRLFRAFFFKIKRDLTFRITLIVGIGVAVFMAFMYYIVQSVDPYKMYGVKLLTGNNMLLNSFSPTQSFGIAIPINLISFTCLEFTQGTVRNKIIAGNSKFKIYTSLFLSGLIFTFALLFAYVGVCTLLGTIFGGFKMTLPSALGTGETPITVKYILLFILVVIFAYITIVSLSIFAATLFRNISPCIPVVLIPIFVCYIVVMFIGNNEAFNTVSKILNPLHAMSVGTEIRYEGDNPVEAFLALDTVLFGIGNNLVYTGIFFAGGCVLFMKRDVK